MLPSADVKFQYEMLPVEKATSARAAAERIKLRMTRAAQDIVEVGKELVEQKKALGHGNFMLWLETEFEMTVRTAQNFMMVYEELGSKYEMISHLNPTALYALAAPSTPEPVRQEVIARAETGEKVTVKEIEAVKKRLAKAEETIGQKEAQRRAQENLAAIADRQAREAANRAMFAEADKARLAEELVVANEEIERLREPGVIHQFNDVHVQPPGQPTPWTDDDAQFLTLQSVWHQSGDEARQRFLEWLGHDRRVAA